MILHLTKKEFIFEDLKTYYFDLIEDKQKDTLYKSNYFIRLYRKRKIVINLYFYKFSFPFFKEVYRNKISYYKEEHYSSTIINFETDVRKILKEEKDHLDKNEKTELANKFLKRFDGFVGVFPDGEKEKLMRLKTIDEIVK